MPEKVVYKVFCSVGKWGIFCGADLAPGKEDRFTMTAKGKVKKKARRPPVTFGEHKGYVRCSGTVTMPDGSRRRVQAEGKSEEDAKARWDARVEDLAEEVKYGARKRAGEISLSAAVKDLVAGYRLAPRDGPRGEKMLRDSTVDRMACAAESLIYNDPIGSIMVKDVTPADLTRWKAEINGRASPKTGRPLSASSKQRAFALIQDVMRIYRPTDDPTAAAGKWHQQAVKRQPGSVLEPGEVYRLIKSCWAVRDAPVRPLEAVYAGLTIFMIYCYPRPGEAYGLQVRDWNPKAARLSIHRTGAHEDGRLKTAASYREIFPPTPAAALLDQITRGREPGEYIFVDKSRMVDQWRYADWLRKQLTRAGIKRASFSPHKLRGTGISYALYLGVSPEIVQTNAGHASISTTLGWYTKVYDDSRRAAASLYNKEVNTDGSGGSDKLHVQFYGWLFPGHDGS